MQQFLVPQFIDVEDKIIGPITVRQFVLMLAAMLIVFIFYKLFSFVYFILFSVILIAVFAILAFARVNGRPIHFFLLNFLQTIKRSKLRIWNREAYVRTVKLVQSEITEIAEKKVAVKSSVSGSRLKDVSLIVNTGGIYGGADVD
ncbi:MAG: PrgI family protein [Patescibacteria group bacterium]